MKGRVGDYRVLLVATNEEREPHPVYPLGAATVAGALLNAGFDVAGVDLGVEDAPLDAAAEAVRSFEPDLIGVSVRAIDNVSLTRSRFYLPRVRALMDRLRETSDAPVVVGGSGYSLFPERILVYLGAELGIRGEGERAIVDLAGRLSRGEAPEPGDGLFLRRGDTVLGGPAHALLPRDRWAGPSYKAFPLAPYVAAGGPASIQTRRGCSLTCAYCTYPLLEGSALRRQEPHTVGDQARQAVSLGATSLFIVDSLFGLPAGHAVAVCRELASVEGPPRLTAFVSPYRFAPEVAEAMAQAGMRSVELGSDAATAATLRGLDKLHTVEDILEADRCCREAGLVPAHFFMAGGPGETQDTLEQTLELVDRLSGPVVVVVGVRIYPGTALHRRALEEEVVGRDDDLLEPRFYIAPGLDGERIFARLAEFAADHPRFFVEGTDLNRDEEYVERLRKKGFSGPIWEFV